MPMRNVLLLAELKALGGCPCRAWRDCLDRAAQSGVRTEGGGGGGARALRDKALHLLRYCAALAWLGPQATAPAGAGPGRRHHDTMTPLAAGASGPQAPAGRVRYDWSPEGGKGGSP